MKSVLRLPAAILLPSIVVAALSVAPARADVVTDWNMITNALVANDVGNNPRLRTLRKLGSGTVNCFNCPICDGCPGKGRVDRSAKPFTNGSLLPVAWTV
jgi:hypothetical protein